MKKIILITMALLLSLLMVGCGKGEEKKELNLYIWSDYIPDQVIKNFETETGIKVVTDYYSSNEEMYAKIKAGGGGYDIAVPSIDFAEIMKKQDMLVKVEAGEIPNLKELDPNITNKIVFDKGLNYIFPFAIGGTGIGINTDKVKRDSYGYNLYNDPSLKGRMTLLDDMREVMTSALVIAGHSPISGKKEDLEDAKKIILGWKKNILKYDSSGFGKGLINGEYDVVQGYYENIAPHLTPELKKHIKFVIPKVGGTMYIDSMVLLKGGSNLENAKKFINYIQKPEVYAEIIDYLETPSINMGARKLRETTPVYSVKDLENATLIRDLGPALEAQNEVWEEILAN